jgi:meso-butanediol dehydrogenase/(S,S)-butanediol dehydrogenase/diacetyl reductase
MNARLPVVLVTGAGSGIGKASAERLAASGWNVVRSDLREDGEVHACDVTSPESVQSAVARCVDELGSLDAVVNAAGTGRPVAFLEATDEFWQSTFDVNLMGTVRVCRAALPHLEKTKGSIVNTASVSGLGGDWEMSPYNAAKGAVVNLTRALALDLGRKGIRVNSVCPSLTRTGMTADMMDDHKLLAKFAERIPLGRVCEPHEVAAVIAFLASEDASFMTGANVTVDGGVSASNGQPAQ